MGQTKAAKNFNNYSVVMTFDEYEDIREQMDERRRNKVTKDRENRIKYYSRQRVLGGCIMAAGAVFLSIGCNIDAGVMQYFGATTGLTGLYVALTKQMILVDRYYLECQDRINEYR